MPSGIHPIVILDGVGVAQVASLNVIQRINAPGHIRAVCAGDIAQGLISALASQGSVLASASFDNGATIASRCVVRSPDWSFQVPSEITIDEDDIWEGYKYTGVDRVIAKNKSLSAVAAAIFDELPGIPGMPNRAQRLAFQHQIGNSSIPVSDDLNAVMLETAVATLARIIGAASNPQFGFYFADAGGSTPTCYIGVPGPGRGHTFSGDHFDNDAHARPDHRACASAFSVVGGTSTHGLPQGFQITGACTMGATFLIAGKVDSRIGGVYGLSHLNFEPRSPVNVGINDLFYHADTNSFYVSTDSGAYIGGLSGDLNIWQPLGKYGGSCRSICADGDNVYMVVADQNAGINALYGCKQTPNGFVPLFTGQEGRGHDGWSNLYGQDLVCCAASGGNVFFVHAGDPTAVWLYRASGGPQRCGGGPTGLFPITKLISTSTLVYILTASAGTAGVYQLDPTALLILPVDGIPSNVTDSDGNPIAIGSVTNVIETINGTWFCTDQGLLVNGKLLISGTRVDFAALGTTAGGSGLFGGTMYTTDGTRVWDSNSGGNVWRDVLAMPVTPHAALPNAPDARVSQGWQALSNASDGNRYYRYINGGPPFASYGNLMIANAPSVTAGGVLTALGASRFLVHVTERLAAQYRQPIETYTLKEITEDGGAAVMALKPTNQVGFSYFRPGCLPGDPGISVGASGLYVIEHEIDVDRAAHATTRTVAATSMSQQPYTAEEIAAATLYLFAQISRAA